MRAEIPSFTACVVAFARATASRADISVLDPGDSVTRSLLPQAFGLATDALVSAHAKRPKLARALFAGSGLLDHVVLRTAAIDTRVQAAVHSGCDQLVILGAGLDARAYRMEALRGLDVYEVDHPASQRYKRHKAKALQTKARALRHVSVDFERDVLSERLASAGFDVARKTVWIWEGVIPYLRLPAIEATLHTIHGMSAPGSELIATYVTRESTWLRRLRVVSQAALAFIGEPLRTELKPQDMATLIFDAGLVLISDTYGPDWQAVHVSKPNKRRVPPLEHIVHARRP